MKSIEHSDQCDQACMMFPASNLSRYFVQLITCMQHALTYRSIRTFWLSILSNPANHPRSKSQMSESYYRHCTVPFMHQSDSVSSDAPTVSLSDSGTFPKYGTDWINLHPISVRYPADARRTCRARSYNFGSLDTATMRWATLAMASLCHLYPIPRCEGRSWSWKERRSSASKSRFSSWEVGTIEIMFVSYFDFFLFSF